MRREIEVSAEDLSPDEQRRALDSAILAVIGGTDFRETELVAREAMSDGVMNDAERDLIREQFRRDLGEAPTAQQPIDDEAMNYFNQLRSQC